MRRSRARNALMLAPALVVTVVLFGGALAGTVDQSLTPPLGGGFDTWTLDSWRDLFRDPAFADSVIFSLRITVIATLLSAVLALLIAILVRSRGSGLRSVLALPVPVPHLLVAIVAVLWLAPGGLADRLLGFLPVDLVRDPGGFGVVLVYLLKETPFLVLLLLAGMGRSQRQREEMAAVLGVGFRDRIRWVIWPAIRAPLAIGSLIVAAFVFSAFEVPLLIGPNYPAALGTYALEVTQFDPIAGGAQAAAALLVGAFGALIFAVAILVIASRLRSADG